MRRQLDGVLNFLLFFLIADLSSIVIPQASAFPAPGIQHPQHRRPGTAMRSESSKGNDIEVKTWNPLRLMVLRLGFTEPAWTSPLNYQKKSGTYNCAYCGHTLFDSNSKYDSGSGWPSFWRTVEEGALDYKMEFDGRLECRCGKCKSHLGHVFLDGPKPQSVQSDLLTSRPDSDPRSRNGDARLPRFCINGASLTVKGGANI